MSEKLIITVDASMEHPDCLTVQDVFTHVLELFQLVDDSDPDAQGKVQWKLVSASMNSPFTVVAEAIAAAPGIQVEPIARQQKQAFRRNYSELQRGHIPIAWSTQRSRDTVKHLLVRNANGIGTTRIIDEEAPAIVVTHDEAVQVWAAVTAEAFPPRKPKEQVGSIEGKLIEVSTLWGKPAIKVRERKSGLDVWCTVPDAFQHEVAEHTSIEDVWKASRVVVRGRILYAADRSIHRVEATSVRRIDPRDVSEEQIADENFTGGLSVTEYLERLRDGSLG